METTDAAFAAVQRRLLESWRADLPGSDTPHLVVGLPSLSLEQGVLSHYGLRIAALEQRYLFGILNLRNPSTRIAFVSSLRVPDYLVEYYVSLVPELDLDDVRRRLTLISLDDPAPRPLSQKLLNRPDLIAQLRDLVGDGPALLDPWNVSRSERDLAIALDIPLYGSHPRLWRLGAKTGGRRLFIEEGVPCPAGVEDVTTPSEVVAAISGMRHDNPELASVVVKLNDSAAGDGNTLIELNALPKPGTPAERIALRRRLTAWPRWYVQSLGIQGGIVEAWIDGNDYRSPSVQIEITPDREVTVLSTHDQILGGASGQVYEGCRFPAEHSYAAQLAEYGRVVARRLAREGVVGRISVDFATVRTATGWSCFALEINVRKGGTTHPLGTTRLLTRGSYHPGEASYRDHTGRQTFYVSTDNMVNHEWRALDPRDVIRMVADAGLTYDQTQRTGVVLHMLECLPIDGRFGLTAIAASREEAESLYSAVPVALSGAAALS